MKEDSIKKRYFYSLFPNFLQFFLSFFTAGMVLRSLGPADFGKFGFIHATFTDVFRSLGTGTTSAFFNYSAKHRDSYLVVLFYGLFSLAIGIAVAGGVFFSGAFNWGPYLWPGIEMRYAVIGALLCFTVWISGRVRDFSDAKGKTVIFGKINFLLMISYALLISTLYFLGYLSLMNYFLVLFVSPLLVIVLVTVYFIRSDFFAQREAASRQKLGEIGKYFYHYSHPLLVAAAFSFAVTFFERWFLQMIAGSVEQGFFTLGAKFSGMVIMLCAAITPIFQREIAKAYGVDDFAAMRVLFAKFTRLFFFLGASLSIYFAFHADLLISIFAGGEFRESLLPCLLLLLDPMYRIYNQLTGSVFLATDRTSAYRNILFLQIFSIPVTYFLLAPKSHLIGGLELGATGLAIKVLLWGMTVTNIELYVTCRYLKLRFLAFFAYQIGVILLLVGAVLVIREGIPFQWRGAPIVADILKMGIDGILFFFAAGLIVCLFPGLAGLRRDEIQAYYRQAKTLILK